jgi:IS1 family transposase
VLETIGGKCADFLDRTIRNLSVGSIELDELWAYVGCKQRNAGSHVERGDQYTFLALDLRTWLIISHFTGKRDIASTDCFVADLASRIVGRVQITCDGLGPYPDRIRNYLLGRLDLAIMQKHYASHELPIPAARRYSPPEVVSVTVEVRAGNPRPDRICTSHVERVNLSVRTFNRRFTRLSLAWSRKLENHHAAVALSVAAYNFCKVHRTLGCTPAVGAKLATEAWTIERLIEESTK